LVSKPVVKLSFVVVVETTSNYSNHATGLRIDYRTPSSITIPLIASHGKPSEIHSCVEIATTAGNHLILLMTLSI
jgi:hypothetical protein